VSARRKTPARRPGSGRTARNAFFKALREEATDGNPAVIRLRKLLRELGHERRGERVIEQVKLQLARKGLEIRPAISATQPRAISANVEVFRLPDGPTNPFQRYELRIQKLEAEKKVLLKNAAKAPAPPSFRLAPSLRLLAERLPDDYASFLVQACDLVPTIPATAVLNCRKVVERLVRNQSSKYFKADDSGLSDKLKALEARVPASRTQWQALRNLWHSTSPAAHDSSHPPSAREAEAAILNAIFCVEALTK
jgi:hypothetical protein